MPHPEVDSEGNTAGVSAEALMHLKMAVCHVLNLDVDFLCRDDGSELDECFRIEKSSNIPAMWNLWFHCPEAFLSVEISAWG